MDGRGHRVRPLNAGFGQINVAYQPVVGDGCVQANAKQSRTGHARVSPHWRKPKSLKDARELAEDQLL
jgi:hypothetical protein